MQVRSVVDRLVDQVVSASETRRCHYGYGAVVKVMKELLDKVVRENTVLHPAEGTSIEVQWTEQDENYLKWFTAHCSGCEA
jgi:hypothetical protein